ncbi:uncharacterized protein LOC130624025 [Hydractinia symbiolongicarpus]|uniref:uncharacterized protein LOC130624025 n=1 Tax=Hydractinia symbiolongicarpus TaxID=13093 RepID=UPI00254BDAA1|nr:uncharacterized protein LOC130624025 [Hydractinia symbiolongicarpus]XP_057295573.1 uncharacterized protein LOC130624025 [Hydractinia symbiolongicarpus]XP_057295574.1 uncharacterized protein LOC130624025 [Hydractinia symbiolongicarpus]
MQNNALKQQEPRTRIIGVLEYYGRSTLLDILHNPIHSNLPRDPKKLFKLLKSSHIKKLEALKKKGIIKSKQWNLIFPPNINETDSGNFDLTLFRILIQTCTSLPPPTNGWTKSLAKQDKSTAAYVLRLVSFRNDLYHSSSIALSNEMFNQLWKKLTKYLDRLGCITDVQHLKASPLDCLGIDHVKAEQKILKIQQPKLRVEQERQKKKIVGITFAIVAILVYCFYKSEWTKRMSDRDED